MPRLLLYCTKAKPSLMKYETIDGYYTDTDPVLDKRALLNGKIVAECDFEVEWCDTSWCCSDFIEHKGLEKSCLTKEQLFDYVKGRNEFYAIYIKNLHIFNKPKEFCGKFIPSIKYVYTYDNNEKDTIGISISPQELCRILNGEQIIIIRKKVLKEMLKNE